MKKLAAIKTLHVSSHLQDLIIFRMLSKVNVVSPHFSLFLSNFTLNPTVQAVKFLPQKPQYVEKNLKSKIEELKEVLLSLVLRGSFRLKVPSHLRVL